MPIASRSKLSYRIKRASNLFKYGIFQKVQMLKQISAQGGERNTVGI